MSTTTPNIMLEVLSGSPPLARHRLGEDLGTVEPEVSAALAENGMLGCAVSWFTRDQSVPAEPLLSPAAGAGSSQPLDARLAHRGRILAR